jgi:hypothetical protein
MGVQIIMDRSGDTRHEFDASDPDSVAKAEEHFQALIGKGFRAVALGRNENSGELIKRFDPNVEETLFIPQFKGG